jgi:hypothetical protein
MGNQRIRNDNDPSDNRNLSIKFVTVINLMSLLRKTKAVDTKDGY